MDGPTCRIGPARRSAPNWRLTVSHAEDHAGDHGATRRDFLYYATAGAGAVAAGAAAWTLINQMNPSADVQALSSIQVDISGVAEGTQLTVKWLGKPVFIRHRTQSEIDEARSADWKTFRDPEPDEARVKKPEWLVMLGVCTHLGCVPIGEAGDYGGWCVYEFSPLNLVSHHLSGSAHATVPTTTSVRLPRTCTSCNG